MKHFALCLALALTCGVALSWNVTNSTNFSSKACADAKLGIQKAREGIIAQKKRMYPDAKEVARLEAEIANLTVLATRFYCSDDETCSFAKSEIKYAEEGIITEKKRMYPDSKVVAKFESDIATFREIVNTRCNASEVCQSNRMEVQKARDAIAAEKKRMYPDPKVIAKLENDIANFKRVITYKCSFNETCNFTKSELTFTRDAIAAEKKRMYPDPKVIANLEAEAANSTEIIFNYCNTIEICSFVQVEAKKAQEDIATEKRRMYPDSKVIARLEGYIVRLNQVNSARCYGGNQGWMRLAEVAVQGGRFLAKLLKH